MFFFTLLTWLNFKLLCSARLAKKSLPSSSSSNLKDEVVVVNDSLPYGEDNAETQEPLDDVEDIIGRLKEEAPMVDEDMSEHSATCPIILFDPEFCLINVCFKLLGKPASVSMVWDMYLYPWHFLIPFGCPDKEITKVLPQFLFLGLCVS